MKLSEANDQVVVVSDGKPVVALDWFRSGSLFLGDFGNFSQTNKLAFVETHRQALCSILDGLDYKDLFSTPIEQDTPHYLSSYSSYKMDFLDAGSVYDRDDLFYASEWFLLFALQVLRHYCERRLRKDNKLCYATYGDWLPTAAAFSAMTGGHHSSKRYEAERADFGKGSVLKPVQNA
jgi:hypothetical protein